MCQTQANSRFWGPKKRHLAMVELLGYLNGSGILAYYPELMEHQHAFS
jgi:hypothetical protein